MNIYLSSELDRFEGYNYMQKTGATRGDTN